MSTTLFILSITCYLVSMVSTLIGSFFVKHIPARIIQSLLIIHLLIFITWIFVRNNNDSISEPGVSNYFFLAFFCTGILCAGIIARMKYPVYLKLYFALFLLSLLVFFVSPSRVLGFISSGNIKAINPERIHISENYYLVEQQSILTGGSENIRQYKMIREMGMFHKTLARDITLPEGTDSVKMKSDNQDDTFRLMIYYHDSMKTASMIKEIKNEDHPGSSRKIEQKRPH